MNDPFTLKAFDFSITSTNNPNLSLKTIFTLHRGLKAVRHSYVILNKTLLTRYSLTVDTYIITRKEIMFVHAMSF